MAANDATQRGSPYVGPSPFKYGQTLYGRPKELAELLNAITVDRIVLLYSPSGAGKTSLINAALIDELKRKRFSVVPVMRVGKESRDEL